MILCTSFGLQSEVLGKDRGNLFKNNRTVDTNVFEDCVTGTTIGDGGTPPGSTELDKAAGRNCVLSDDQLLHASLYVVRLSPEGYGGRSTPHVWNCTADDVHAVINYVPAIRSWISGDRTLCGTALARLVSVMCGPEALNSWIFEHGFLNHAEPEVLHVLGGEEGHYDLLMRHMTRRSIVGRNMLNHWLQKGELFGETSLDKWGDVGKTLEEIFDVLRGDDTITFVREKATSGRKIVMILMDKLRTKKGWEHAVWEDTAASWFRDFLTKGDADDSTGLTNGLFFAFGLH